MKIVYKYPLSITDNQVVRLRKQANIVHVGLDPLGNPCLWAEVDTEADVEERTFVIRGTGQPLPPESLIHVASFCDRSFVWHLYEVLSPSPVQ